MEKCKRKRSRRSGHNKERQNRTRDSRVVRDSPMGVVCDPT